MEDTGNASEDETSQNGAPVNYNDVPTSPTRDPTNASNVTSPKSPNANTLSFLEQFHLNQIKAGHEAKLREKEDVKKMQSYRKSLAQGDESSSSSESTSSEEENVDESTLTLELLEIRSLRKEEKLRKAEERRKRREARKSIPLDYDSFLRQQKRQLKKSKKKEQLVKDEQHHYRRVISPRKDGGNADEDDSADVQDFYLRQKKLTDSAKAKERQNRATLNLGVSRQGLVEETDGDMYGVVKVLGADSVKATDYKQIVELNSLQPIQPSEPKRIPETKPVSKKPIVQTTVAIPATPPVKATDYKEKFETKHTDEITSGKVRKLLDVEQSRESSRLTESKDHDVTETSKVKAVTISSSVAVAAVDTSKQSSLSKQQWIEKLNEESNLSKTIEKSEAERTSGILVTSASPTNSVTMTVIANQENSNKNAESAYDDVGPVMDTNDSPSKVLPSKEQWIEKPNQSARDSLGSNKVPPNEIARTSIDAISPLVTQSKTPDTPKESDLEGQNPSKSSKSTDNDAPSNESIDQEQEADNDAPSNESIDQEQEADLSLANSSTPENSQSAVTVGVISTSVVAASALALTATTTRSKTPDTPNELDLEGQNPSKSSKSTDNDAPSNESIDQEQEADNDAPSNESIDQEQEADLSLANSSTPENSQSAVTVGVISTSVVAASALALTATTTRSKTPDTPNELDFDGQNPSKSSESIGNDAPSNESNDQEQKADNDAPSNESIDQEQEADLSLADNATNQSVFCFSAPQSNTSKEAKHKGLYFVDEKLPDFSNEEKLDNDRNEDTNSTCKHMQGGNSGNEPVAIPSGDDNSEENKPSKRKFPPKLKIAAISIFIVGAVLFIVGFTTLEGDGDGSSPSSLSSPSAQVPSTVSPTMSPIDAYSQIQIDVLSAFYSSSGGTKWKNSENWLTNTPVCSWYGIECDENHGRIFRIDLDSNGLSGR